MREGDAVTLRVSTVGRKLNAISRAERLAYLRAFGGRVRAELRSKRQANTTKVSL